MTNTCSIGMRSIGMCMVASSARDLALGAEELPDPGSRGAIVVGIDPGLTRCGVGAVQGPAHRPTLIDVLCVTTPVAQPVEERLDLLHQALAAFLTRVRPQGVAVERVLFSGNARTAMATGQAAGVALLAAAQLGIPVISYSPNEVKQTVTGDGRADKQAVARLVAAQLGLDAPPRPVDVTDALAVAITHLAHSRGLLARLGTPARSQLEQATAEARQRSQGGWERVAAARVAGGRGR
jgi:crossover junction endodeoxyribonuclease RuvC